MKTLRNIRLIAFLGVLLFVNSNCGKNTDPNPDLTKDYVGTWKTDIQGSTQQIIWFTYEINRISDNLVKVNVKMYLKITPTAIEEVADEYEFDSVKIEKGKGIQIRSSRTLANAQTVDYDGMGIIKNDKLVLNLVIDYDKRKDNNLFTIELTKQ